MTGQLQQPRSILRVNGVAMAGWLSWSWDGNTMFQADTFHCEFAMDDLPATYGRRWWAEQTDIEVEILIGFPREAGAFSASELDSLFVGHADDVDFDWAARLISVSGRDRTADFIDNKTSEKFPNLTSSQIAQKLAAKHGLTAIVTATTTKVGKYYAIDHVRLEDDRTEWDLLTWLAREEQFVCYVKGRELYFEPKPDAKVAPYKVAWSEPSAGPPSADHTSIKTSRTLTVAKDITVTVRSWNSKQKKAFAKKAVRARPGAKNPQQYVYTIAGLTPEQCQQRANQLLAELSRHEMRLNLSGPADNVLGKTSVIALSGTGTAFDQTYYPDVISREFSPEEGYRWTVQAKNHSSESEANL